MATKCVSAAELSLQEALAVVSADYGELLPEAIDDEVDRPLKTPVCPCGRGGRSSGAGAHPSGVGDENKKRVISSVVNLTDAPGRVAEAISVGFEDHVAETVSRSAEAVCRVRNAGLLEDLAKGFVQLGHVHRGDDATHRAGRLEFFASGFRRSPRNTIGIRVRLPHLLNRFDASRRHGR